jgi:hypothetical protein
VSASTPGPTYTNSARGSVTIERDSQQFYNTPPQIYDRFSRSRALQKLINQGGLFFNIYHAIIDQLPWRRPTTQTEPSYATEFAALVFDLSLHCSSGLGRIDLFNLAFTSPAWEYIEMITCTP